MAVSTGRRSAMTLDEFLRLPYLDEKPYLEYIDGRIEAKVSPQAKHSLLQGEFLASFNGFARPLRLGRAFAELRFTFAGRSILPDVAFLLGEHIVLGEDGEIADLVAFPPDIHVEILSPDKRLAKTRDKLAHSTSNGCALGILVHPYRHWIELFRNGVP